MPDRAPPTADALARPGYDEITLYAPNRAPARIDLSDNTNLWGIPPAADRAIRAGTAAVTRYPSLYADALKSALAAYLGGGTLPEMIVTGCGSDDVLDAAIRAFAAPDAAIAFPDPSFAMIPIFARANGLAARPVPLAPGFDVDAAGMLQARARITYLCSPNNPTGTAFSRAALERVVAEAPGIVIIDEAYAEFAPTNALDLTRRSPRVLVARTMSKAFGLAGLRVGYGIGHPALVAAVEKARGPYKVNALAERAALAALGEDIGWVRDRVAEAIENRERFVAALRTLGLAPLPSAANFVLVPVAGAAELDRRLRGRGIAVRPFERVPGVGDALRISIGPWELLHEVLDALAAELGR